MGISDHAVMWLFRIIASIALTVSLPVGAGDRHTSEFILPSGVHVQIVENNFAATDLEVVGCNENSPSCLINPSVPFGVLDEEPKSFVESIEVSYKGRTYVLDASNMYNAWGGRPLARNGIRYFGAGAQMRRTVNSAAFLQMVRLHSQWNGKSCRQIRRERF